MSSHIFCCPVCQGALETSPTGFACRDCARHFPVVNGVPDFFVAASEHEHIDAPNQTWLDPEIVAARDTTYRLCARELQGMAFCMQELGRRTFPGCRVLEVGMGTGHFTRWLAEVVRPGTQIYAFDFSWPIIERALDNTAGAPGVTLLRANARGRLPFHDEAFDILLLRLAPLGPQGVPKLGLSLPLLKPGGWFFEAGWEKKQFETPPAQFALQQGYERAEHHAWLYPRWLSEEEHQARLFEEGRLAEMCGHDPQEVAAGFQRQDKGVLKITEENLTIAQKPNPCEGSETFARVAEQLEGEKPWPKTPPNTTATSCCTKSMCATTAPTAPLPTSRPTCPASARWAWM